MTKEAIPLLWNLCEFLERTLGRLPTLQSLDLGMETSFYLHKWPFEMIQTSLIFLKISLHMESLIIKILLTKPLSYTLQQLHVRIQDLGDDIHRCLRDKDLLPRMESLHTFTYIKSLKQYSNEKWTFVNILTSCNVLCLFYNE